jgi:anti-anti-sigma factor
VDRVLETAVLAAVGGAVRLRVVGQIDSVTVEQLDAALVRAMAIANGRVHIDLGQVSNCSSEGVLSLAAAWNAASVRGIDLSVVAASGSVRRMLHIFNLCPLLTRVDGPGSRCQPDQEDA